MMKFSIVNCVVAVRFMVANIVLIIGAAVSFNLVSSGSFNLG